MHGIIKHKPEPSALPDLRNLGTILRILLAVNGAALCIAFVREPRLAALASEWAALTGHVEPTLIALLAIMWALQPVLQRMRYDVAVATLAVITLMVTASMHFLIEDFVPQSPGTLLREMISALALLAGLLFYFRLRARALSPAITEARLQALQARIRPHFLFNSINAVLSLVRTEPARAEVALEDMAELFRVLMRDNRDLAPLADEVRLCTQYLDLEQLRLGERLVVDWNVKSMPADALVPPLVLQPLLENAVYHGIEPSSSPGILSINIFTSRDEVHVILKNPYVATRNSGRSGNNMALANVRERLALHFDAEASLTSRTSQDVYEVHIRMPYRTMKIASVNSAKAQAARTVKPAQSDARKERIRDLPSSLSGVALSEVTRG